MESLPEELPEAMGNLSDDGQRSDVTVVDLATTPHEALMEMSRASAGAPLGQLLPEPPGILPEREAHLTGKPAQICSRCPSSGERYPLSCHLDASSKGVSSDGAHTTLLNNCNAACILQFGSLSWLLTFPGRCAGRHCEGKASQVPNLKQGFLWR